MDFVEVVPVAGTVTEKAEILWSNKFCVYLGFELCVILRHINFFEFSFLYFS